VVAYPHTVKSPSSYYFVTPKARTNTPAVNAFRDWLLGEVNREFDPHAIELLTIS
jgi:DNA-binding transcriptional LysR family regulator